MNAIPLKEWLDQQVGEGIVEMLGSPVVDQLSSYDTNGTGVGFVIVLAAMTDMESDDQTPTHYDVTSVPVAKIRNIWMTVKDENLADIMAGVIRSLAPGIIEVDNGSQSEISEPDE